MAQGEGSAADAHPALGGASGARLEAPAGDRYFPSCAATRLSLVTNATALPGRPPPIGSRHPGPFERQGRRAPGAAEDAPAAVHDARRGAGVRPGSHRHLPPPLRACALARGLARRAGAACPVGHGGRSGIDAARIDRLRALARRYRRHRRRDRASHPGAAHFGRGRQRNRGEPHLEQPGAHLRHRGQLRARGALQPARPEGGARSGGRGVLPVRRLRQCGQWKIPAGRVRGGTAIRERGARGAHARLPRG